MSSPESAFEIGTDGPSLILVGLDGSRTSMRAGAYAAGLARRQGCRLLAVYVGQLSSCRAKPKCTATPDGRRAARRRTRDQAIPSEDLIDFRQPVGLLLVSVLHFVAEAEDPWRIVATLRDALAPGSYLMLAHGTSEGTPSVPQAVEKVYKPRRLRRLARPLARGDPALLRRLRPGRSRPGLPPGVAARLARRGVRRPGQLREPGRRGTKAP